MVEIKGELSAQDFYGVVFNGKKLALDPSVTDNLSKSYLFLEEYARKNIIYGINTGFGPMAQYKIAPKDQIELQYNLIRSHAAGSGNLLTVTCVKAAMLARLKTLSLGYSGVHPSVLELLVVLINREILPLIYEHGGVGASGDLVQLAHMALALIGEGQVYYKKEKKATASVFKIENLEPIKLKIREGLGIMNGTSVMTGIGLVNTFMAKRLLKWQIICSAIINEIAEAYSDHLSLELNQTKKHKGQQEIARLMREHLKDSSLVKDRNSFHSKNKVFPGAVFNERVQEYYSLRCVPQILGPIYDTINNVEIILVEEINSANDNPIIHLKNKQVYHGGNFHGDYVSLEMDKLKIVITKMTLLAERQLNYLLNPKLNEKLPPFVNLGKLGLNFGLQGLQFTATSTAAENQMLSNPMYVHTIPNNNDNQDIVSMGTNAALIAKKTIENAYEVVAIEIIGIIQSLEYLQCLNKSATRTKAVFELFRPLIPIIKEDITPYPYIEKVKQYITNNDL